MRFSSLSIDGFGLFHDASLPDLPAGLILIQGENEAGKTTLLEFIRAILFGPRRSWKDYYLPAKGGTHGGRLGLKMDDGREFVLERQAGPKGGAVSLADPLGPVEGKEALERLLGGATAALYKNVYAFSLRELQEFDSLQDESVRNAIYGASAGLAMKAVANARQRIDKRLEGLFKPGGSNPVINVKLACLEAVREQLRQAKNGVDAYDAACAELKQATESIESLQAAARRLAVQETRIDSRRKAWGEWAELVRLEEELGELEEIVESFPENGIAELDRLAEALRVKREQRDESKTALEDLKREAAELTIDQSVLAQCQAIALLAEERGTYVEARSGVLDSRGNSEILAAQLQAERDRLDQALKEIDPNWTVENVETFDPSLAAQERVQSFRSRLEQADRGVESARVEAQGLERALRERRKAANEALADLQQAPTPAISTRAQLEERHGDLRALRRAAQEFENLNASLGHHEERLADKQREQIRLEAQNEPFAARMSGRALAAGAGVLAIAGGAAIVLGDPRIAVIFGALAALWAVVFWLRKRWAMRVAAARSLRDALDKEMAEIQSSLAQTQQDAQACHRRIAALQDKLQLSADPALQDLDRLEDSARRDASLLERRERLEEAERQSRLAVERAEEDFEAARTALRDAEANSAAIHEEWRSHLQQLRLAPSLDPSTAGRVFDKVESARQALRAIADKEEAVRRRQEELRGQEKRIQAYERRAAETFAAMGRTAPRAEALAVAVDDLARELDDSRRAQLLAEEKRKQIRSLEAKIRPLGEAIAKSEEEKKSLLQSGGSQDEQAFRRRGRLYAQRRDLLQSKTLKGRTLLTLSGETDLAALKQRLAATSREELDERQLHLAQERAETDRQLDECRNKQADLTSQLKQMCSADDVARLRAEEEELLAEIEEAAAEWRRHALAGWLLQRAGERFEKEHQPGVLRDTGAFFSKITGGRYSGIIAPIGGGAIEVATPNGGRKTPEALSRGAAEQLYLALRFGYIRHRAKEAETLPIVMDDILVNFDPQRAERAAEAILDLSGEHQILYFTCHPQTAAVFQRLRPGLPLWRLKEGSFQRADG